MVSAVDLSGLTSVPVVAISPLVRREDIERVTDAVRAERQRGVRQELRSSILTMVEPGLFHSLPSVASKQDALALMCTTMYDEGVTTKSFYQDVMDRETRSSTPFGGPFAIPHSMKMDAHRSTSVTRPGPTAVVKIDVSSAQAGERIVGWPMSGGGAQCRGH